MSYLVLARKSRPQNFDQVIGQRPVVKTLENSLARNRVAHALLFSGVRGVGKTTLARIMAKAINCENRETETPPCNHCLSCREITAGSSLDLYEIDGASNRGIQEIRELKEKIKYLPTSASHRIVIIDEVHMLTTEAFNALLKTLEEPPEHVYFMFATTEIHKIPITILSRCQQYELKKVRADELASHFSKLLQDEGRSIDDAALNLIVREAAGSVRDGLSLLDQILSFSGDHISTEDTVEVLGLIDRDLLLELSRALLDGDTAAAIHGLENLFRAGIDVKRFCTDLIGQFRTLLFCKINGCRDLIDLSDEEFAQNAELAKKYSGESLHNKMNMLIEMLEEIGRSAQPRLILETTFLKIIESGNVVAVGQLIQKVDALLQQRANSTTTTPAPQKTTGSSPAQIKATPPHKQNQRPKTAAPNHRLNQSKPQSSMQSPRQVNRSEASPPPQEEIPLPPEPPRREEEPSKPEIIQNRSTKDGWANFIKKLNEDGNWMGAALGHVTKMEERQNSLILHYDDAVNSALLQRSEHKAELEQLLLDFFQKKLKVEIVIPEHQRSENSSSNRGELRNELMHNPLVIATAEIFRGHVGDIRPIAPNKK